MNKLKLNSVTIVVLSKILVDDWMVGWIDNWIVR